MCSVARVIKLLRPSHQLALEQAAVRSKDLGANCDKSEEKATVLREQWVTQNFSIL
jgi:hypothetical protein